MMMRIHRSVRDRVPVDLVWEECTLHRRGSRVVETVLDDGADFSERFDQSESALESRRRRQLNLQYLCRRRRMLLPRAANIPSRNQAEPTIVPWNIGGYASPVCEFPANFGAVLYC